MTRLLGSVLLVGVLACVGCIATTPPNAKTAAATAPLNVAKSAPPVTPDQVTPTTAHRVAQSLAAEMDREAQEP